MSQEKTIPGLDELLGIAPEGQPRDFTGYRNLQNLKQPAKLSDARLASGFEDLLRRRETAAPVRRIKPFAYGAVAAIAVFAVAITLFLNRSSTQTPEIAIAGGGSQKASAVSLPENKLVAAKIEDVDLQFRGVTGLSAESRPKELLLRLDSGFLNVSYHPGEARKKLTIIARGTTFTVTGTKFFVEAGAEIRLLVTEGRVMAAKDGKSAEVTPSETWSASTQTVRKLTPAQSASYAKVFTDTAKKPTELTATISEDKTAPAKAVSNERRIRLHLNLGQVVSGTLVSEDSEAVSIATSSGKTLRISRSEIEKIERLR